LFSPEVEIFQQVCWTGSSCAFHFTPNVQCILEDLPLSTGVK